MRHGLRWLGLAGAALVAVRAAETAPPKMT